MKMKKFLTVLTLICVFSSTIVNAQEKKPAEKSKKESSTKEIKSCDKEKKSGCCAKMAEKK